MLVASPRYIMVTLEDGQASLAGIPRYTDELLAQINDFEWFFGAFQDIETLQEFWATDAPTKDEAEHVAAYRDNLWMAPDDIVDLPQPASQAFLVTAIWTWPHPDELGGRHNREVLPPLPALLVGSIVHEPLARVVLANGRDPRFVNQAVPFAQDPDFWLEFIQADQVHFARLPQAMRNLQPLALAAVTANPNNFVHLVDAHRDDLQIALVAVQGDGLLLQHASERLRGTFDVAQAACEQDPTAAAFVGLPLLQNERFLHTVRDSFRYRSVPRRHRLLVPVIHAASRARVIVIAPQDPPALRTLLQWRTLDAHFDGETAAEYFDRHLAAYAEETGQALPPPLARTD